MNGEAPKPAVITRSIVNAETDGQLTVIHKKDEILRALGHIWAIPHHIIFGRLQDIGVNPAPELVEKILSGWKDVPWKGEVTVRIDHIDPKADWERTIERLRREGKSNKLVEAMGLVNTYRADWMFKLKRSNFYNSWTRTAHIFHPDPAISFHELGHAKDLNDRTGRRGLFLTLRQEWTASKAAMQHLPSDTDRKHAMKLLEPAFGTYIGGQASKLYLWGSVANFLYSALNNPKPIDQYKAKIPKFLTAFFGLKLVPVALAHIYARLPGRARSFGYIFKGETVTVPESLQPHQMLVATARPSG